MKKSINRICFAIGYLALTIGCILACSKDFEGIILDDFDFSFTEEHQTASFVFEPNRTSFSLSPEKEISTTDYFVWYAADKGKGYFLSMEGDTLRERDTLLVIDKNWSYNYVAIDTGAHRIKVTAWDSNSRKKELQLD